MPKSKRATLKARLAKAERLGYESGFTQGRKDADRMHKALLERECQAMRAELLRDARLARFETVTQGVQKMFSAFGQSLDVLSGLGGEVD